MEKKFLTSEELKEMIARGERNFPNVSIEHSLNLEGITVKGNLSFRGIKVKEYLSLEEAKVKGDLLLNGAEIGISLILIKATIEGSLHLESVKVLGLKGAVLGGLILRGATIKEELYLTETTIGYLDLSTKKGPQRIFVSSEMADRVHLAAPTVPLVVER